MVLVLAITSRSKETNQIELGLFLFNSKEAKDFYRFCGVHMNGKEGESIQGKLCTHVVP